MRFVKPFVFAVAGANSASARVIAIWVLIGLLAGCATAARDLPVLNQAVCEFQTQGPGDGRRWFAPSNHAAVLVTRDRSRSSGFPTDAQFARGLPPRIDSHSEAAARTVPNAPYSTSSEAIPGAGSGRGIGSLSTSSEATPGIRSGRGGPGSLSTSSEVAPKQSRTDVVLLKTADGVFVPPGAEVRYTVVVRNTSTETLTDVVVIDVLPEVAAFVQGSVEPSETSVNVGTTAGRVILRFQVGTIGAKSTRQISFKTRLGSD
jgi:uncharacterized repeat protein (TIGR01451 family)